MDASTVLCSLAIELEKEDDDNDNPNRGNAKNAITIHHDSFKLCNYLMIEYRRFLISLTPNKIL
jgi:hypothetical protein